MARNTKSNDASKTPIERQHEELLFLTNNVKGLRKASELSSVKVVPSVSPGFNRASKIGGIPLRCIHVSTGPQHGGKSLLEMMKCISFTNAGHYALWIDAEYTFDKTFYIKNGGNPDLLLIDYPESYESTVKKLSDLLGNFIKGKKDGVIPEDKGFFVVVDTINKLAPAALLAELAKEDKFEDKARSMGMVKALLNQAWLDLLTPIIGQHDVAVSFIAQEREKVDMSGKKSFGGPVSSPKGGKALLFDNSFQVRVSHAGFVKEGSQDNALVIGKRHKVHIIKNKVGFPDEIFYFYTGNGKGVDGKEGLDYERGAFNEAEVRGWVVKNGSWFTLYKYGEQNEDNELLKAQGENKMVIALRENPEIYQALVESLDAAR